MAAGLISCLKQSSSAGVFRLKVRQSLVVLQGWGGYLLLTS